MNPKEDPKIEPLTTAELNAELQSIIALRSKLETQLAAEPRQLGRSYQSQIIGALRTAELFTAMLAALPPETEPSSILNSPPSN